MKRNDIIKAAGLMIDAAKLHATICEKPGVWGRVGELERFANDLCNAPTQRNQKLGVVTYTLRQAVKKYRELVATFSS